MEWRRLVAELTPDLADPETDGPLPGRELQWALHAEYRVRIALDARDWPGAQKLQEAIIVWERHHSASALAATRNAQRQPAGGYPCSLAVALQGLGHIQNEQGNSGCLDSYFEAMTLYQRIGDRQGEGIVAYNLGHAYKDIPDLRDLDQAEHWYKRSAESFGSDNKFRRAQVTGQLGLVAYGGSSTVGRPGNP